jgi:hypothetical protein
VIRAIALDFLREGGYSLPKDRDLHKLAVQFAEKQLVSIPNFAEYTKVWVAAEMDGETPTEIRGALGFTMRPDFTLARFLDRAAVVALYNRANAFLADNGARGSEVLVFVSSEEGPEQRCPQYKETLEALKAKPADRYLITIR